MAPPPRFRPLVKWPGGKTREWGVIAPLLPAQIRDFADPFMGGLAPFALTPFSGRALLNDRHERLVDLHVRVQRQDADLFASLIALGRAWESLAEAAREMTPVFRALVAGARAGDEPSSEDVAPALAETLADVATGAAAHIAGSVADKARRLPRLERKHGMTFGDAALAEHCETALRSGFYFFVREREGRAAAGTSSAAATADFLFVRDFCYGSMFRHNADGGFNIPYGGTSYNAKRFLDRVGQMRAPETRAALARAEFSCGDFEPLLAKVRSRFGPDDFVFLDPPYDSDFKSYGPAAFGEDDHGRLAASLAPLASPWLLVIKETDFVRATYLSPAMRRAGVKELHAFGKKYGYNVRGRNERATRHVAIANYAPPVRA